KQWSSVRRMFFFPDGKTLFTALSDGTALTWDVSAFPVEQLSPTHTEADMAKWWDELAGDAPTAYGAIWKLVETPSETLIPFLKSRLRPIKVPSADEW